MIDAEVLRRRLDALTGYLARLERFRSVTRDAFVAEPDVHHLAERYRHLAMESVLDIANRLITDAGLEAPETHRDAFAILARAGILDQERARHLQLWTGFRNVLAHAYLAFDHGLAWDSITRDLGDLRAFAVLAAGRL